MKPAERPKLTKPELLELLSPYKIDREKYPLVVVGIRGYYKKTMGDTPENDRGIYDDAIFIDTPNVFKAFNGNTDPSIFRKGTGTGTGKGIANLIPGLYYAHRLDMHNGK
ncbi:MAG: hypothetical protein HY965_02895, partial [Ignavibacteriales bacterium]|nr:hypothetical protein [Ignavibacteriales bacterium]